MLSGPGSSPCSAGSRSRPATSGARTAPVRRARPPRSPGCWPIPTPTRSGCPTRACRSSTRSSTSGPTPSAERATRPGSTSRPCCGPTACRCSRSTRTGGQHVRPPRLQPLGRAVYTNLLNCVDLAGVPVRAADRRADRPADRAGGHCTYNPEPLADFVDFVVLGDGEEVVSEITKVIAAWKARPPTPAPHAPDARPGPGRLRALALRVDLRRRRARRDRAPLSRRARRGSRSARSPIWASGRTQQPARAAHRGRARPAQRRGVPRLHARLPVLPGRHDHPPGARAPGRAGPHDGARGPGPHRLRRGGAHEALDRQLLGHRGVVARHGRGPYGRRQISVSLPSLRVDAFTVGIAGEIQKARRTGLTFAPEAARGACGR